jgi:hypothetical protein
MSYSFTLYSMSCVRVSNDLFGTFYRFSYNVAIATGYA